MNPFTTSPEATAYVLDKIFEQAASDGSIFSDFERRLLYGVATKEEIDAFEDRNEGDDAKRLWRKLDVLVRHGLEGEGQRGGREVQRRYEAALRLAATDSHYLAQILKGLAEAKPSTRLKRGLRRWAMLLPICFVGGIALATAMSWIVPAIEKVRKTSTGRMLEEHGTLLFFAILLCIALAQKLWWKSRLLRWGGNASDADPPIVPFDGYIGSESSTPHDKGCDAPAGHHGVNSDHGCGDFTGGHHH
jgi:hypothetical protein